MQKLSYFKIGLFVIAASLIAVVGVIVLGVGTVFRHDTLLETYVDESVQGLDVGSAVKFRGVPIGKVEKITLTSAEYSTRKRYVLVRVGIAPTMFHFAGAGLNQAGFKLEVDRGLRLRLAAQGLTGVAYIEADYADPQRNPALEIDWQPIYPYIPSTRSRITQLSESLEKILRSLENVDLGRLVDGMEKSLGTITKVAESVKFEKLSGEAVAFLSEVRETNRQLKELVGAQEFKSAASDAAAAAKGARAIITSAEKPMQQLLADLPQASESMTRLIKRLDGISGELPETSAQLRQSLRRLNRLLASQQNEIQNTMENIRSISENVKELSEDSKRFPSQAIFGAPPPQSEAVRK
ncbi:MAG: MCE family protein [Deltaproteobacteria bacterium]|nr:MCE family protein [Deltaproteobacteria bacterium]